MAGAAQPNQGTGQASPGGLLDGTGNAGSTGPNGYVPTPIQAASEAVINNTGPLYSSPDNPTQGGEGQTGAQVASAFVNPQAPSIYQNINQLGQLQNAPNYANAPLAGLTALGATQMAGNTNLGNTATAGNTNINTGTTNALTAGQIGQINQLNQMAQGQGPSVAAVQAQQTGQQNVANQMAMLASQRGSGNTALGLRSAGNAAAVANQQAVQAATLGRTQEELGAQQQLTGALGGANSQAAQSAQAQAALTNQNVLANAAGINQANQAQGTLNQNLNLQNAAAQNQAMLQQGSMNQQVGLANQSSQGATQGLNAQEANNVVQAQMAQSGNDMSAAENYENMLTNQSNIGAGLAKDLAINSTNNQIGMAGAGIGGIGALGAAGISAYGSGQVAASDSRLKKSVKSGDKSVKSFLAAIGSTNKQTSKFNLSYKAF